MYIPTPCRELRLEVLHQLMRSEPLSLLISGAASGLNATPIPFLIYADEGAKGTLRAHLARANPHWRELQDAPECLVVFQGPQGYITPSWYPSKAATQRVVPTWNYATVQAWGRPRVVEDAVWLQRQLADLTRAQEGRRARPWALADAPQDFIAEQMRAIVGVEIPIERIEGKWKMSQNRPAADRAGVVTGLNAGDDAHANPALAELVAERHQALKSLSGTP